MKLEQSKSNVKRKLPSRPKKKGQNKAAKIILVLAGIILIVCLVMGALVMRKYAKLDKDLEDAKELYNATSQTNGGNDDGKPKINPETGVIRDFEELHKVNPDIRAWISIPDTKLDLPVVQGVDNEYYLYRNLNKEKAALGIPFIDHRAFVGAEHQSANLTIYGHAAKNGSHFAPVKEYKDIKYYKDHPIINFNTIYGNGAYKIIGFFMEDVGSDNTKMLAYHDVNELDKAGFDSYISEINKRSYFKTGVDAKFGDQLITLSTCDEEVVKGTSTPFRCVLVARKVRSGEKADVDISKATINKEMIMPDKWVSAKGKENPYK